MTHSNWKPGNICSDKLNFSFYHLRFKTGVFNLKKQLCFREQQRIVNFISELQCGETDKWLPLKLLLIKGLKIKCAHRVGN